MGMSALCQYRKLQNYSITMSAVAKVPASRPRPNDLAVVRLITIQTWSGSARGQTMTDAQQDRIKLFQFPRMFGIPNISPFCCKLETWLRMTGISYEVVDTPDPRK